MIPEAPIFHEGYSDDGRKHGYIPFDEHHPMWHLERISLNSVGIDIGSATSHLVFSNLVMRRQGLALSNRFVVIKREIFYESPIWFTPYIKETTIDTKKLESFIHHAYKQAGLTSREIDTGAVIVTGEAAKKKNAEAIARLFSTQTGKFVCATAGHNLEATLAAFGSGAVGLTQEGGNDYTLINVDIGGGTSKIAIVRKGVVVDTAALEVGARLVSWDDQGAIQHIEAAAFEIAACAGVSLGLGQPLGEREKEKLATVLCNSLFELLERGPLSCLVKRLLLTPEISFKGPIDAVIFSGGVSEYIYEIEKRNFGDLGLYLGREVRERISHWGEGKIPVKASDVRIRATVIGASQYTIQVSGNTIYLSRHGLLPLRSLQVVTLQIEQTAALSSSDVFRATKKALYRCDILDGERPVALAIGWKLGPSYSLIHALAEGIVKAMKAHVDKGQPLVLVFDADIAKSMGYIIEREFLHGADIISIDGVDLKDFDFIDIGEELPNVKSVPVVIKSLVFQHAELGRGHSQRFHRHYGS